MNQHGYLMMIKAYGKYLFFDIFVTVIDSVVNNNYIDETFTHMLTSEDICTKKCWELLKI